MIPGWHRHQGKAQPHRSLRKLTPAAFAATVREQGFAETTPSDRLANQDSTKFPLARRLGAGQPFTEKAESIALIGGTGTDKTRLATALGEEAVGRHGKRVPFFSTIELVNAPGQEEAAGTAGRLAYQLLGLDLVVLNELGYLPFSQADGALLFHLLSKL